MTTGWLATIVLVAAVAALVAAAVCMVLLQRFRRLLQQQQSLAGQLEAMDEAMRGMEARLDGMSSIPASAVAKDCEEPSEVEAEAMRGESIDAEIAPEIQAAIAAAAVAVAGDKARVHSMRLVKAEAERSAWSQQGRMQVQTSHNVRTPR